MFGGIWLFVGSIMLVVGVAFALQEREFATDARTATGMVLTKTIVPADSDSSTQYRVRYRFTTDAEEVIEGSDEVSVETWESLAERGPIDVRYLATRPTENRLASGSEIFGAALFLLFGVVFAPVGGFLVARAVRGMLTRRRLLATGTPARATVTGVEQTNVSFNRRQQFKVGYRYRDSGGQDHEGESGYLDWTEAGRWNEGDSVAIRYDPARPADSQWVGAEEPEPRMVDAPPA